jgi:hypothetical protein
MVVNVLKNGTTLSIGISSDLKCILNKKFGNLMFVFEFKKLIKIARNGLKIQEFAWR